MPLLSCRAFHGSYCPAWDVGNRMGMRIRSGETEEESGNTVRVGRVAAKNVESPATGSVSGATVDDVSASPRCRVRYEVAQR